jgi:hypothetical protein
MPDEDRNRQKEQKPAGAEASPLTTRGGGSASAADEAPARRPQLGARILTRTEREALRSRLQKKFH